MTTVFDPIDRNRTARLLPGLSVIVPVYNRPEGLTLTLRSLADQSLDPTLYEVIVSDDGSHDVEALRVIKEFEPLLSLRYVYQPDRGFRVASARNQGLALARHVAVVLVDAGVIVLPKVLAAVWRDHRRDPSTALIGSVHGLEPSAAGNAALEAVRTAQHPGHRITDEWLTRYPDPRHTIYAEFDYDLSKLLAPWNHYWTALTTASTRMLRAIGGFDESYTRWGIEDLECGYRLMAAGAHFQWDSEVRAFHWPDAESYPKDNGPNWEKFYARHQALAIEVKLCTPSVRLEHALRQLPGFGGIAPPPLPPLLITWLTQEILHASSSWALWATTETTWPAPQPTGGVVFGMSDRTTDPTGPRPGLGTRTSWPDGTVDLAIIGPWWPQLDRGMQRAILEEAARVARTGLYLIVPRGGLALEPYSPPWTFRLAFEGQDYGVFRATRKPADFA